MPSQRSDFAFVEVAGKRFEFWTSYSFDSDLFTPADGFRLGIGLPGIRTAQDKRDREQLRADLAPGSTVKIYIGTDAAGTDTTRHLQMSGVIDTQDISASIDSGSEFEIEGRDGAGVLVDSSTPIGVVDFTEMKTRRSRLFAYDVSVTGPYELAVVPGPVLEPASHYTANAEITLAELATSVCSLWGIQVTADSSASRDILTGRPRGTRATVDSRRSRKGDSYASDQSPDDVKSIKVAEARPQPGETAWQYLDRHAKRLGVMMWFSPSGRLILGSPQYTQESRGRIVRRFRSDSRDPNNASGSVKRSIGDRYSQVTVLGRGSRKSGGSKITATALDPDWTAGFSKPLIMQDQSIKTIEEAQRRAERELSRHKASALTLSYTLEGHGIWIGDQRYLYATDTMVDVLDEVAGIEGRYYVTKRTFVCDRQGATSTQLQLVPPGSIVL